MVSYLIKSFVPADMEINQQNDLSSTILEIFSTSRPLKQAGSMVQALSGSAFNM